MIKILSFIIFIAAFVWTWTLFNSKNAISTDVHAGIQSKLAILIEESIKSKRPQSSNFQLQQMYTEKMDDNKVKAFFTYNFTDQIEEQEKTEQTISGQAILNRSLSEDKKVQKWVIQSVKTDSNNVEFKEGLVITSEDKTATLMAPQSSSPMGAPATSETQNK